ncbi:hypothetical protein EOD43_12535 [Sphingomonas crocodyli]|uniref:Uncharacterized protein n=2 Tax=Sphingomonas crocodyli TaxID=1979270 RepID=A0A437MC11_9SPHN|nr:hypothetical protein EOD43_12535 [Sphingomonas crocodyli]
MARKHGINIDLDQMLAGLPAPPAPPTAPVAPKVIVPKVIVPKVTPPAPPSVAAIPDTPGPTPVAPKASAAPSASPAKPAPVPAPLPMITVRIPTLSPDTATIQVGASPPTIEEDKERGDDYKHSPLGAIADQAMNGYFFFAAWGALFLALSYAAAVRIAERESARYRTAARDAELRALRYQVNPHFLFNTLNSLSTLVLKDKPDEAEKMILNLSTFFRTSLTADPKEDVTLAEEIRLQRLYLDIEAVRFPERLSVDIQIPENLKNACVPCLILQPLVENAIKYGVSRSKRPVNVKIIAREDTEGLVLTVEDDGDPIDDKGASKGTGVGLRNVIDRLRARFGEEAACRHGPLPNGGFGVTIFMPLIRDGR